MARLGKYVILESRPRVRARACYVCGVIFSAPWLWLARLAAFIHWSIEHRF